MAGLLTELVAQHHAMRQSMGGMMHNDMKMKMGSGTAEK